MKLVSVEICNFMSVVEATLYLENKGLVSIEGLNNDGAGAKSNGAGKSTIINAIMWCNYGEPGKNIKADSVVNNAAGRDCRVSCLWHDDTTRETFKITRYRKHSKYGNDVRITKITSKGEVDISRAGSRESQEQINQILGQDLLTFKASCFAQQNDSLDIPGMSDKQLKELLEKVLPFDDLNEAYARATKSLTALNSQMSALQTAKSRIEGEIESTQKHGKELKTKYLEFEADRAINTKALKEKTALIISDRQGIEKLLCDKEPLMAKRDELTTQIRSIKTNYSHIRYAWSDCSQQIASIKRLIAKPENTCRACNSELTDLEKYIEAKETLLKDKQSEYDKLTAEMAVAEAKEKEQIALIQEREALEESIRAQARYRADISRLEEAERVSYVELAKLAGNPFKSVLRDVAERFNTASEERVKFGNLITGLREDISIIEKVQQTFSPKGVRYNMLEEVAPALTDLTNTYLSQLTDGGIKAVWSTVQKMSTGEYKEKFSIQVNSKGCSEYGALSGGEQRKVKLACFFALQDIISRRATKEIKLWCVDEIDHALDPAGVERLMSLLEDKVREKETILVISHNELREWIPNYSKVYKKDSITKIEGYLCGE